MRHGRVGHGAAAHTQEGEVSAACGGVHLHHGPIAEVVPQLDRVGARLERRPGNFGRLVHGEGGGHVSHGGKAEACREGSEEGEKYRNDGASVTHAASGLDVN